KKRTQAWCAWQHEVFADIYGVLGAGPAFVLALMDYLATDTATIQTEETTGPEWGDYPTRFLRMKLNFEVLRQLNLLESARETLQQLGLANGDMATTWNHTYEFHLMAHFDQDLPRLVEALLDGAYPQFGGKSLREVLSFSKLDLEAARDRAHDVNQGN